MCRSRLRFWLVADNIAISVNFDEDARAFSSVLNSMGSALSKDNSVAFL